MISPAWNSTSRAQRQVIGSPPSKIKTEFRSPGVQLGELPGPGSHGQMFVPGPRLVEAEFRDELVHLRVEFDDHPIGIIVITGNVVARRVARGTPQLLDPGGTKTVRRHCMACGVLELEGDVMKPRLRSVDQWWSRLQVRKVAIPWISSVYQKRRNSS